jgi:hypothetical protein
MPQCIYCGQEAPSGSIAHVTCERDYKNKHIAGGAPPDAERPYQPSPITGVPDASLTGGEIALHVLGWMSFLAGLFFLLVSPNITPDTSTYSVTGPLPDVINLHKMFLGQALTIAGAVFLAAAWRPLRYCSPRSQV